MIPRKVSTLELGLLGGALVLVGLGVVLLRGEAPDDPQAPRLAAAQGPQGVQAAEQDGARRDPASGDPPAPAPEPTRAPIPGPTPEPAPEPSTPVDENAATRALHPQVSASLTAALEAQRTRVRNACFKGQPLALKVEASFDPDGRLLVLNIPDDPRNAAASACVRDQRLALAVDPPGRHVTVEVPFALP